jgi:predicted ATPase
MLKSWSIENFKPIVNSGELKLAPVTVLAGLNSSGKTSLLQSILMIAQTLSNQVVDRPLILNGPAVRLGTFEDVLSDFSATRSITCAFELGKSYEPDVEVPLSAGGSWNYKVKVQLSSANENSSSSAIEAAKVIIDNIAIKLMFESGHFELTGPFDEKLFKSELKGNFFFKRATEEDLQQFLDNITPEYLRMITYGRERHNYLGECNLDENLPDIDFPENEQFQVLATLSHFLPSHFIRKVQNDSLATSKNENVLTTEYLAYLDEAVQQITTFFTSQVRYLGPLRFDPSTTQRQFSSGELDDVGSRGEHAALVYQSNQLAEIEYYNPFSRKVEVATLQVALDSWIRYLGVADQIRAEATGISDVIWKVILKPEQNPRVLLDVGFGVSQVLPILVMGLLAPEHTLLIIEQPELHLHPRVQARLGDFFVGLSKCNKQCLIETHSENLVNQLRYHIVAAGGQEKSDCIIYFVDQDEKGATQFEPVEISPQGNILNWPSGFFDETMHQEDKITAESIRKRGKLAKDG